MIKAAEITGRTRAVKLIDEARKELLDRLSATKAGSFTEIQYRGCLAQAESMVRELVKHEFEAYNSVSGAVSKRGVEDLIAQVKAGEKVYSGVSRMLPLNEALSFFKKREFGKRTILEGYRDSIARYGHGLIYDIRKQLSLGMLTGEHADKVIDRIAGRSGVFQNSRWKAERIWRTELANAYEGAKHEAARWANDEEALGLKKRLVAILDGRTGDDSRYVHGQTRDLDKFFTDNRGRDYAFPPNRPNDRETVIYVRDEWGEDALETPPVKKKPETILRDDVLSKDTLLKIEAEEAKLKKLKIERLIAFDREGKEIFRQNGGKSSVSPKIEQLSQIEGRILTHSHPVSSERNFARLSFSNVDIRSACIYKAAEIRAVSGNHTFRMRPPKGRKWDGKLWYEKIEPAYIEAHDEVGKKLAYKNSKQYDEKIWHETWKRVAKKTGIRYNRIKGAKE